MHTCLPEPHDPGDGACPRCVADLGESAEEQDNIQESRTAALPQDASKKVLLYDYSREPFEATNPSFLRFFVDSLWGIFGSFWC